MKTNLTPSRHLIYFLPFSAWTSRRNAQLASKGKKSTHHVDRLPRPVPKRPDSQAGTGVSDLHGGPQADRVEEWQGKPIGGEWWTPLGGEWWSFLGTGMQPSAPAVRPAGLGYVPDIPDHRDHPFDLAAPKAKSLRERFRKQFPSVLATKGSPLQGRVHLGDTGFLSPVEDQGHLNSCTANAVIGMVEYLMRASGGPSLDMSRMFLYKNTRRLLGWTGDPGAYIRTTIKAMCAMGVPPEQDWPYDPELLDKEPEAYHFALAENFKAVKYGRLDSEGTSSGKLLDRLKQTISSGFPVAFGFPLYQSITRMGADFVIPLPGGAEDKLVGGHAVLAVGFDDSIPCVGQKGPGAIIVRNSWGETWGDFGYAYLPYQYVLAQMALDFWSLFSEKWLDLPAFDG